MRVLFVFITLSLSKYMIEYTHKVETPGVMYAMNCHTPGCNTAYHRETGYHTVDNLEKALYSINHRTIREDPLIHIFNPKRDIIDFKFVALYNCSHIELQELVTKNLVKKSVMVEKEVEEEKREWILKE